MGRGSLELECGFSMKTNAIRFSKCGGPEVLEWRSVDLPALGPRDVLVRHKAIGVNFIDTYFRSGLYPLDLPSGLGLEASGVIEAVGKDVNPWQVGDRVALIGISPIAYAQSSVVPEDTLLRLPSEISFEQAAAMIVKGLTAAFLLHKTYPVTPGETILVHAAAGGVGSILSQWAKHLGCRVIGTVGSENKVSLAKRNGCDEVILYRSENVPERVRSLTAGKGVDVVYDSVGKDTFDASLDSVKRRGMVVTFGNASGPVPPVSPLTLSDKGSLFLTRPSFADYIADPSEVQELCSLLFSAVSSGVIEVDIPQTYPLENAAEAHRALESSATTGSTVLIP